MTTELIIFNHFSVADFLKTEAADDDALYVELATAPLLALRLGLETPSNYPGVLGLAHADSGVETLSVSEAGIGAHTILAPALSPCSIRSIGQAVSAWLEHASTDIERRLLVHIDDVAELALYLGKIDAASLYFDVLTPPSEDSCQCLRAFITELPTRSIEWKGVRWFNNGLHLEAPPASIQEMIDALTRKIA